MSQASQFQDESNLTLVPLQIPWLVESLDTSRLLLALSWARADPSTRDVYTAERYFENAHGGAAAAGPSNSGQLGGGAGGGATAAGNGAVHGAVPGHAGHGHVAAGAGMAGGGPARAGGPGAAAGAVTGAEGTQQHQLLLGARGRAAAEELSGAAAAVAAAGQREGAAEQQGTVAAAVAATAAAAALPPFVPRPRPLSQRVTFDWSIDFATLQQLYADSQATRSLQVGWGKGLVRAEPKSV